MYVLFACLHTIELYVAICALHVFLSLVKRVEFLKVFYQFIIIIIIIITRGFKIFLNVKDKSDRSSTTRPTWESLEVVGGGGVP